MLRQIKLILNPAAGKEEPILSYINTHLNNSSLKWDVSITQKLGDGYIFAKQALAEKVDLIVVYGGDGTVMEVVQALYKHKTPILILAGGTANVLAKELGMPLDVNQSLQLIAKDKLKYQYIDMGLLNNQPFILRVNTGVLAHMITDTTREMKNRFGQLAYSINGLRHLFRHRQFNYQIKLDGVTLMEQGAGLMVTNVGNIGLSGISVSPKISLTDGKLDVILFQTTGPRSLLTWLKSYATNKRPKGSIKHWQARNIKINFSPFHSIICDDLPLKTKELVIKIIPRSLRVATVKL
jgi:diacylglycerol kinase (ATP)